MKSLSAFNTPNTSSAVVKTASVPTNGHSDSSAKTLTVNTGLTGYTGVAIISVSGLYVSNNYGSGQRFNVSSYDASTGVAVFSYQCVWCAYGGTLTYVVYK